MVLDKHCPQAASLGLSSFYYKITRFTVMSCIKLTDDILTSLFNKTTTWQCEIQPATWQQRPKHTGACAEYVWQRLYTHRTQKIAYYTEHTASISFTTSTSANKFNVPHVILRGFRDIWLAGALPSDNMNPPNIWLDEHHCFCFWVPHREKQTQTLQLFWKPERPTPKSLSVQSKYEVGTG